MLGTVSKFSIAFKYHLFHELNELTMTAGVHPGLAHTLSKMAETGDHTWLAAFFFLFDLVFIYLDFVSFDWIIQRLL